MHLHLLKTYSFEGAGRFWCTHKPLPLLESSTNYFIEISCPADVNVEVKEAEKLSKYRDLANDFYEMYRMKVTIIPVVLGCTGVVSIKCLGHLKKIPNFSLKLFANLQKAAIIGTIRTLRTIPLT